MIRGYTLTCGYSPNDEFVAAVSYEGIQFFSVTATDKNDPTSIQDAMEKVNKAIRDHEASNEDWKIG
jgi:regulator of protease activity HflC (stomatin/prohibitin superfamily)